MSEVAEMRRGPAGSVRSEPRTEPNGAPFMKGWLIFCYGTQSLQVYTEVGLG